MGVHASNLSADRDRPDVLRPRGQEFKLPLPERPLIWRAVHRYRDAVKRAMSGDAWFVTWIDRREGIYVFDQHGRSMSRVDWVLAGSL